MRIFGKELSRWWLLLLLPVTFPALPMLFFVGNGLAAMVFGPPAIWNRPWNTPNGSDLVGSYSELANAAEQRVASITLNGDGSMRVANLPYESLDKDCVLSGVGKWHPPDSFGEIDLDFVSDGARGSCESSGYGFLEVTGLFKPHGLYWVVGDPDSGTGVWLRKGN